MRIVPSNPQPAGLAPLTDVGMDVDCCAIPHPRSPTSTGSSWHVNSASVDRRLSSIRSTHASHGFLLALSTLQKLTSCGLLHGWFCMHVLLSSELHCCVSHWHMRTQPSIRDLTEAVAVDVSCRARTVPRFATLSYMEHSKP